MLIRLEVNDPERLESFKPVRSAILSTAFRGLSTPNALYIRLYYRNSGVSVHSRRTVSHFSSYLVTMEVNAELIYINFLAVDT
jgi:hypothetical protein